MSDIVMLAGDWHGNDRFGVSVIDVAVRANVRRIYHLGDLGIWPGESGKWFLNNIENVLADAHMDMWVTPGNHEDYDQINTTPIGRLGLRWIRPHIGLIPRGHRWEDGGVSFVSLGGAPSIDFEHRTLGKSWWKEEMITLEEAEFVADGGYADVMLAHDSPDGGSDAVEHILNNPGGWSHAGLAYAKEGRMLMNIAVEGVQPKIFAHGHFHVKGDTQREHTRFLTLHMDGNQGNVCFLRLSDLAVQWL